MQDDQKAQITTTTTTTAKPKRPGLKSDAGPSRDLGEKTTNGIPARYYSLPLPVRFCCENLVCVLFVFVYTEHTKVQTFSCLCKTHRQV